MSGSLRLCLCPVTGQEWCMPAYSSSAAWITLTHLTTVSPPYCTSCHTPATRGASALSLCVPSASSSSVYSQAAVTLRNSRIITKPRLCEDLFNSESMEWPHLIQFLCVFSVRKISSILGISVDHGKNVSGWQAVCSLILCLFHACCDWIPQSSFLSLFSETAKTVKYENFYSMKVPPVFLKELATRNLFRKQTISMFLVKFRMEFRIKIPALIAFNPNIWFKVSSGVLYDKYA